MAFNCTGSSLLDFLDPHANEQARRMCLFAQKKNSHLSAHGYKSRIEVKWENIV